jgi:hypothetical protein
MNRRLWGALAAGAAISLAVSYGAATQSLVVGSFEGGWYYGYRQPFTLRILLVFLVVTAPAGALLFLAAAPPRRAWPQVLIWIAIAVVFHWALRSIAPFTLERLFVSDSASSFYSVTEQHGAADILDRFSQVRSQAPLHARSNMPGKPLLVHALKLVSSRTWVLPWLIVLISNAGAALMYLFVRDLFDDKQTALFSAVLYLFVPARIFFFPLMNTVTPVAALGCACLLIRWLRTGRTIYAALLGIALYGLAFFEPLPLAMGLLFGALVLRAIARGEMSPARFVPQAAGMVLVFIATSEAINWGFDFELVGTFRRIGAHAVEFNATDGRPYWVWVRANLGEFLFGMGLCQAAAFCAALDDGLRGGNGWLERLTRPITVVCLGLAAVLFALDLLGINRGEVIRLWIFLACFFQIPAAYVCSTLHSRGAIALVVASTVLHAAIGTAMIGFVIP